MASKHGGKRTGAGRKRTDLPIERNPKTKHLKPRCVYITDQQAKLLRMWGHGDMSAGLRWLIDSAELLVHKITPLPQPESPPPPAHPPPS